MGYTQRIPVSFVQDAPTRVQGSQINLGPNQYVILGGGILGRHRKRIHVFNDDGSDPLYIVAGPALGVDPKTSTIRLFKIRVDGFWEAEHSDEIVIKNVSGSRTVGPVYILETFYQ